MFPEGRIFDFVIIGVLALIVVGPKDLPILMRKVGKFVAHMRSMAAEFRASFDEMARQSELDDLRREVESLRTGQTLKTAVGLGDDLGVQGVMDDIHKGLQSGEAQLHPPLSDQAHAATDTPRMIPLPTKLPEPKTEAPEAAVGQMPAAGPLAPETPTTVEDGSPVRAAS